MRTLLVPVLAFRRDERLVEHVLHLRLLLLLLALALALQRPAVAHAAPADRGEHERDEHNADRAEDDQVDEQLPCVSRQLPRRVLALQARVRIRTPAMRELSAHLLLLSFEQWTFGSLAHVHTATDP